MQLQSVLALALAGTAFALPEKRADPTSASGDAAALASIYGILATALPSSLVGLGLTNPGALATQVNSQIAAGQATWYTQLPPDVQSYLKSVGESQYHLTAATTPVETGVAVTTAAPATTTASAGITSAAATGGNSTIASPSLSASHSGSASASRSATAASTGGASMPTAVLGAGLAGAIGLIGMLAL